jgi:glucose/arabinose dehydrogenase
VVGLGATSVLVLVAACTGPAGTSGPDVAPPLPAVPADPSDPRAEAGDAPGGGPGGRDTSPPAASAPGLPPADAPLPALRLSEVARAAAPTDTTVLADGTVLVAERAGVVRVLLEPGGTSPADGSGRVLVDVRRRTTTDGERGLLAMTVSPDGAALFLSLTDRDGDTLIEAHPLRGARITGPPRTVFAVRQPRANHNGGALVFAPDGMLLVGLGDGGGSGDPEGAGQDLSTPLGAVLRLDVRSTVTVVPPDNPFVGRRDAAGEVAAYGLRNPWRMSLDAPRGELWIADVGQAAREEINRVHLDDLLGANFGWALREGNLPFRGDEPPDHLPPLYDYAHGPGCAVTGGHVYRGAALPELVGAYVFSDFCDGELRALFRGEDERSGTGAVVARALGVAGEDIVGFGVDARGEMLVLELTGRILRLVRA